LAVLTLACKNILIKTIAVKKLKEILSLPKFLSYDHNVYDCNGWQDLEKMILCRQTQFPTLTLVNNVCPWPLIEEKVDHQQQAQVYIVCCTCHGTWYSSTSGIIVRIPTGL